MDNQPFRFFDKDSTTGFRHGASLPHWTQPNAIYFVTFRLADSLPRNAQIALAREKDQWLTANPPPHTHSQQAEYQKRFTDRIHHLLDAGYGSMILRDAAAKSAMTEILEHDNGSTYHLDTYAIAGNHVHALVSPGSSTSLTHILKAWKSISARKLLALPIATQLRTRPTVWQKESFDHIVRSLTSLQKFRAYIQDHLQR